MKTKGKITLLLAVVAALLIGANAFVMLSEDDNAPVINLPSGTAQYTEGMTDSELLEGVTATDDRDGDVSDSIRVGEILRSGDGSQVTVVYVARDSKDNIAQASRIMQTSTYGAQPSAEDSQEESGPVENSGDASGGETAAQIETPEPTEVPVENTQTDANELGRAENDAAIAALPAGAPRMYLTEYAVSIPVGTEFNSLGYVEDIQDDLDLRDELFTKIQITGNVDITTPGTYELFYYVIDNDGNTSNQARLSVTVA
ncbi:MAG TPA: DUF5011 domain-containing protein [Candidatus Alectryocaccobium stercorigallinarum]|nr:DUF5011 domain-containing protein [Candidatus Alectryocaccobium stercorigallinarum]